MKKWPLAATVAPLLLLVPTAAYAQAGISSFNCAGVFTRTIVQGINNYGQLVGQCDSTSFLYSNGVVTYLEGSYANGINNLGQIAGWNGNESYLYSNGTYTAIQYPGAWLTDATAINDNAVIVGAYQVSQFSEQQHGFVYSNGVYTTVDYPGAASTNLTGINNAGEMVGAFCLPGCRSSHGFLVDGSNFTQIDFPGAQGTAVFGINNNGVLVGGYNNQIAFIYENGSFESVDYRNSADTALSGINDRGEFVGYWLDAHQNFHGLRGICRILRSCLECRAFSSAAT